MLGKYLADRGPHLAAMVAYYALLSLFPFLFLMLSTLGLAGQVSGSSYLIRELERILPSESVGDLVKLTRSVQANAGTFFVLGLIGILWSIAGVSTRRSSRRSTSSFGSATAASSAASGSASCWCSHRCAVLFTSLLVATLADGWLHRHEPGILTASLVPYLISLAVSSAGSFAFLMVVYGVLTNVDLHRGDVWPGAVFGTLLFQISFQAVPLYLQRADLLIALRAFGGLVLLLVWLYLMANVIVLGAEINYRHWSRHQPAEEPPVGGLA